MSYSIDLRERGVKYRLTGHTIKETCEVFGVGNYGVSKWIKQYKETGDLSNKPLNRGYKKIDPEKLKAYVAEHPDAYQKEIAEIFGCSGSWKSIETSWNYTKKKTLRYCEQNEEQVKEYLNKIADIPKEHIAYVHETGIDSYLYCEYGYAPKGKAVNGKILGRKFQRTNIVAAKL
ncbi:MAG: IS630 transposase-related protein, partial [Oscillospiraceae bacterium]|nr:IS630 transposase-related protein [Oscillospiraceae bacterium]